MEEPTPEEAEEILKGLRPRYEKHHGVKITDEAVEAAVKLSERYINDRYLPDKAIDLIDEASSRKQLAGYQVPRNLEELQKKTEELAEEKEAAVLAGDFEKAAALRDEQAAAQKKFLDMQQRLQKKMVSGFLSA